MFRKKHMTAGARPGQAPQPRVRISEPSTSRTTREANERMTFTPERDRAQEERRENDESD